MNRKPETWILDSPYYLDEPDPDIKAAIGEHARRCCYSHSDECGMLFDLDWFHGGRISREEFLKRCRE